ncbi:MAG TPA: STAS/SEC14 domain-containing protein [Sulfurovum sp.]|nr:STAS/SEC14 domain-containing protein [Sulfurovum sp.]
MKGSIMLNITLDREKAIVTLEPEDILSKEDFDIAVKIIDSFVAEHGKLTGLIIASESFSIQKTFSALVKHLVFIKKYHKKLKRLAVVTDSDTEEFAENIISHFINAEVRHFPFEKRKEAREWILQRRKHT